MYYKSLIKPSRSSNWGDFDYSFHQEVWSLFPGINKKDPDFIYRAGQQCLYTVSRVQPIATTGKWLVTNTAPYDPQVSAGLRLDFMTRINPVNDRDGARYSIIMDYIHNLRRSGKPQSEWPLPEEIRNAACSKWFKKQEKTKGFSVSSFLIEQQQDKEYPNDRTGDLMKFTILDIRGTLTVTDPDAFKQALFLGIGKGRRFGYGMLMVKAA